MIGELEVIFLKHPVTIKVRVVRQLAILLEHLRGVAARPAIHPVKLLATAAALPVVVVTASATTVVIVVVAAAIVGIIIIQG